MPSFQTQLRTLVDRLGTSEAASICGVTPRALQLWMKGEGNPNAATQAGAILLLTKAAKASKKSAR